MKPKKLSMQLTPLLDLLLIVIFAQFMEVNEQQDSLQSTAETAVAEHQLMVSELAELNARYAALQHREQITAIERARAQSDAQRAVNRLSQAEDDLDEALNQHRVMGELMVELFQLPESEVSRILNPNSLPGGVRSPEDLEQLKERFRKLAMQRSGKMIEHLLSYEEIRKRCDVWNMHVDGQDNISLSIGENSYQVRILADAEENVDHQRLLNDLYGTYRSLPEPKSLVIILLTHERKTRRSSNQAVKDVMPQFVAQMQADRAGQFRFEYADLGFRIE